MTMPPYGAEPVGGRFLTEDEKAALKAVPPTVDESYDKNAGEFSGGPSVGEPSLLFPNVDAGAGSSAGERLGPATPKSHHNMRRMYASDPSDELSYPDAAGLSQQG